MTSSVEAAIPSALFTALDAFAEGQSPGVSVAYPDIPFVPVAGDAYLEATFLPNATVPFSIAHSSQLQGLLQVAVMWPAGAGGLIPAMELAGQVIEHFAKGSRFEDADTGIQVLINRRGWIAPPLQEPDRLRVPITIPYLVFAT